MSGLIVDPARAAWLERRRAGIGSSDIAGILGVSPWTTPLDVYLDKKGLSGAEPEEALRLRMGREMEPIVSQLYVERTGNQVVQGELVVMEGQPFLCTPDRMAEDRVVELKTADPFKIAEYGEPGTDQVPEHYLVQVTWQMMMTGRQLADLAVLFGLHRFEVYQIKYNPDLGAILRDAAADFWAKYIIPDVAPPMDGGERARRWLEDQFKFNTGEMLAAEPADDQLAFEYITSEHLLEEAKEVHETLRNKWRLRIGEADGVQGSGWTASWKKNKDGSKTDWEAVAAEVANQYSVPDDAYSGIVSEATKVVPGPRVLRFHAKKGK